MDTFEKNLRKALREPQPQADLSAKVMSRIAVSKRRRLHSFALGAAAFLVLAIVSMAVFQQYRPQANNVSGAMEGADGTKHPIKPGEVLRAAGDTVLSLPDGSRIEMRRQSELVIQSAADDLVIQLNTGSIIVTAAKQRDGHLHVRTKDVTVSVLGTVFLVNAEETGSRVAVIDGEVQVQLGTTAKLLPGDQMSTNPLLPSVPVIEEISWSRNAAAHSALLQQAVALKQQSVTQSTVEGQSFELAAVRPSTPRFPAECGWRTLQIDPKRFLLDAPLYYIVALAYGKSCSLASATDLISGPGWIRSDWFAIHALIPENSPNYSRLEVVEGKSLQLQLMLQRLLADRFKLKAHREMKDLPVYLLTLGNGGPKFINWTEQDIEANGYGDRPRDGFSRIEGSARLQRASMTTLAIGLANAMREPVLDRTGLTGEFNYILEYVPLANLPDVSGPSLFSALEEQLGLKLERARGSVEILVIDRVEKPTEN